MKSFLMAGLLLMLLPDALHSTELTLNEKDAGKEEGLRKGDLLTVILMSNPTTGYSWSVLLSKKSLLGLLSTEYRAAHKTGGIVGAGGTSLWKFKALDEGSLQMTFSYVRPWEQGIPPVRVISWPVTIRL